MNGEMTGDCIALADESPCGEPLLREVMRDGQRVGGLPQLPAIRDYCRRRLAELPASLCVLEEGESPYEVRVSPSVKALAAGIDETGE